MDTNSNVFDALKAEARNNLNAAHKYIAYLEQELELNEKLQTLERATYKEHAELIHSIYAKQQSLERKKADKVLELTKHLYDERLKSLLIEAGYTPDSWFESDHTFDDDDDDDDFTFDEVTSPLSEECKSLKLDNEKLRDINKEYDNIIDNLSEDVDSLTKDNEYLSKCIDVLIKVYKAAKVHADCFLASADNVDNDDDTQSSSQISISNLVEVINEAKEFLNLHDEVDSVNDERGSVNEDIESDEGICVVEDK